MLAQQIYDLIQPFVGKGFMVARSVEEINQHIDEFIVIKNNDEVIACCGLKEHKNVSEIYCLAIHSKHHGSGVAKKILSQIERSTHNDLVAMSKYQGEWFIKQGFEYGNVEDLPQTIQYNYTRQPKIFIKRT